MTSIALPLSTDVVIPSQKATRLVRQDLPLEKPCWLSHITSLSSMCLNIASRRICSMIFPGTEVRLTGILHYIRLLRAPANLTLNASRHWASTTSLGNLLQWLTTLMTRGSSLSPPLCAVCPGPSLSQSLGPHPTHHCLSWTGEARRGQTSPDTVAKVLNKRGGKHFY